MVFGSMEHSDSESDFELHEVDPVVDGFSDDFSETSSEEHQERDSGQEANSDDVDSGNDTDGADIHDADDVQPADDAAETEMKGTGKKRLLQVSDHCSGVEIVLWICSCCVSLCRAEGGTDFGRTPNKPRGL